MKEKQRDETSLLPVFLLWEVYGKHPGRNLVTSWPPTQTGRWAQIRELVDLVLMLPMSPIRLRPVARTSGLPASFISYADLLRIGLRSLPIPAGAASLVLRAIGRSLGSAQEQVEGGDLIGRTDIASQNMMAQEHKFRDYKPPGRSPRYR